MRLDLPKNLTSYMNAPLWQIEFESCFTQPINKGGLKSESAGEFSIAIINIPFYYPKLLHPLTN